jgi:hypothetical protein
MTKYKILLDTDKYWDKTIAHFTDLFSLRMAYGNNNAANSGFESKVSICNHSSAQSVITSNTESDFTQDLYIKSLEESLAAACNYCTTDAATCTPVPPSINHFAILQTELAEQRKQVTEVMAQNTKFLVALSKGDGSGGSGSGCGGKGGGGDQGG